MGVPERVARPPFAGRRVALCVTGGIAAYKSVALARDLTLAGAAVDVVATPSALEFVQPLSFEALTGRPVFSSVYAPGDPLLHIRLATEADVVIVAPATANFLARAAAGMADDLASAILLATRAPVLLCPAMNDRMYEHAQTQANLTRLAEIGYAVFGPAVGPLAWGEGSGRGRMEEPVSILEEVARLLTGSTPLRGLRVLVTAGGTREPIDAVRFLGNRSSGRMGYALAAAAHRFGAEVTLLSGPAALPTPAGVTRIDVETAEEMFDAVSGKLPSTDVLVMAAAVADFRPASAVARKIKKDEPFGAVPLERTVDILQATIEARRSISLSVGFALETENAVENGRRKLAEKELDLLVVNDATEPGAGFEVPTNRVTLIDRKGGTEVLPLLTKEEVALRIMERIADLVDPDGSR